MDWNKHASNLIKSELKKRGITYEQLQEKLGTIGVEDTMNNINRKINRGTFSFVFLLQVMKAIGAKNFRLDEE